MNIDRSIFIVVDTETTGRDPASAQPVEIGAVATSPSYHVDIPILGLWQSYVQASCIPSEASAVHGITDDDVSFAPSAVSAKGGLVEFIDRFTVGLCDPVLVAHNADYEAGILGWPRGRFLCTMRLAQHLWPDLSSYKNLALRYSRNLKVDTFGIAGHRSLADCLVTAELLRDALASKEFHGLGITSVEDLIAYADSPVLFSHWPFGKYRNAPISVAPNDYIRWCLNNMDDLTPDMRFTLEQRLKAA